MNTASMMIMMGEDFGEFGKNWDRDLNPIVRPFVSNEWQQSIFPALKANAISNGCTPAQFQGMCFYAWKVTRELFEALHSNVYFEPSDKEKPEYFWCHQKFDLFRMRDVTRGIAIYKQSLLSTATLYLSHPEIRTNRLDWLFLDTIVFAELEAFAGHVFTTNAGIGINRAAIYEDRNRAKYHWLSIKFFGSSWKRVGKSWSFFAQI